MQTFQFKDSQSSLLPFSVIIILFAVTVASFTSNGEMAPETEKTNEQYLITGKIKDRKLIWGTNRPPAVVWTNENGISGRSQVFIPESFKKIDIIDYQIYRIEHRLVGGIFFSTNVPMSNIVLIISRTEDTNPDLKPCIVFAKPYSLPDDVIQNNNLQDATILQIESIFKEGPRYNSLLKQYGIKPEEILAAQVTLKPEALEVNPGILTAFVRLPAGYPVSGITSATCDGAPSERMMLSDDQTEMIIKFRRQDIEAVLGRIGQRIDTNFVVRGVWRGAAVTNFFEGADSITKIVGGKSK